MVAVKQKIQNPTAKGTVYIADMYNHVTDKYSQLVATTKESLNKKITAAKKKGLLLAGTSTRGKGFYYTKTNPKAKQTPVKVNPTVTDFKKYSKDKLHKLAAMFQGKANGQTRRTLESDFTPNNKYRLGHLVQIKVKEGNETTTINFDGESYLAADAKNNLYIVGKDARLTGVHRPKKHYLEYIGKLIQVDYVTAKSHIEDGKTVRFYHKLGEATKEYPSVFMDHDGFLLIHGGAYDIWDVGVVN